MGVDALAGLGACSVAGFALIVDSFITVREKEDRARDSLVSKAREAIEQGDVMKAIQAVRGRAGSPGQHSFRRLQQRAGRF
jgi:hypothetical protein